MRLADRTGPLVLIGPPGAGKSACAEWLARETGVVRVDVDERYWVHFRGELEIAAVEPRELVVDGDVVVAGRRRYLKAVRERLTAKLGEVAARRAIAAARAAAALRLVEGSGRDAVVDFGAGHSIVEDADLLARMKQGLRGARVVLLLPCMEPETAVAVLSRRLAAQGRAIDEARLRGYLAHPSNRALADVTLYDEGRPVAEIGRRLAGL